MQATEDKTPEQKRRERMHRPAGPYTERYEFAHGKRPRGRGYWAFDYEGRDGWAGPKWTVTKFAPGEMTYRDAAAWAVRNYPPGTFAIYAAS